MKGVAGKSRILQEIERNRKAWGEVKVLDPRGRPARGAHVSVEQIGHRFEFCAVLGEHSGLSGAELERARRRLNETFERVDEGDESRKSASKRTVADWTAPRESPPPLAQLRRELDRLSRSGAPIEVRLSATTCVGAGPTGAETELRADERRFSNRLIDIYHLCFSHGGVEAIEWSSFAGPEQRDRGDGLMRSNLSPTPAQKILARLLGSEWHTRGAGQTDEQGVFRFFGFEGEYRITARSKEDGKAAALASMTLAHGPQASAAQLRLELEG